MVSSRLLWKLLLVCAAVNLLAALLFGRLFAGWGLAAAVGLAAVGLGYWLATHVVRPVAVLAEAAETMAAGDYSHRVYVANRDELGTLARSLNQLSADLDARMDRHSESRARQATVLDGMIEGVVAVDARQRIVLANPAAGRLFGFRSATAEGRALLEVVRNHALHEAVTAALASGRPQRLETNLLQHPGDSRQPPGLSVEAHVQPMPGRPCPGVVLVMHDTTELRRLESMRRDFMANVSHELKTPLSSIKAYAETLRNGALNDPAASQRFLQRIEEQADRLNHLIHDMLTLARIESAQQAFDIAPIDVQELVAACLDDHRPAADAKRIRLAAESVVPCRVQVDREGLRDILDNLVDNAIKYTPAGGSVTVRWEAGDASGREQASGNRPLHTARIAVCDTGIGVKPEDQRRVFERFYRVDKARSRELGGTGLGLAIVKHLAQAFGGHVGVDSTPGRGSTFWVELPSS